MGEAQQRATFCCREFDSDLGFRTFGRSRDPREFNESRMIQAEESAIMRMPLTFEFRLEEEGCAGFRPH